MERRDFLKFSFAFAAGAAALAASAQAAPLPPVMPAEGLAPPRGEGAESSAQPAVVTQDDVDHLKPEEVRWGRRRWGFRRRRWGFRRRRFFGFRRRRHWRRRRWFW